MKSELEGIKDLRYIIVSQLYIGDESAVDMAVILLSSPITVIEAGTEESNAIIALSC